MYVCLSVCLSQIYVFKYVGLKGSAATLLVKRLWIWGIACRWESIQARDPAWLWNQGQTSSKVQNKSISGPTKRTQVFKKKKSKKRRLYYVRKNSPNVKKSFLILHMYTYIPICAVTHMDTHPSPFVLFAGDDHVIITVFWGDRSRFTLQPGTQSTHHKSLYTSNVTPSTCNILFVYYRFTDTRVLTLCQVIFKLKDNPVCVCVCVCVWFVSCNFNSNSAVADLRGCYFLGNIGQIIGYSLPEIIANFDLQHGLEFNYNQALSLSEVRDRSKTSITIPFGDNCSPFGVDITVFWIRHCRDKVDVGLGVGGYLHWTWKPKTNVTKVIPQFTSRIWFGRETDIFKKF